MWSTIPHSSPFSIQDVNSHVGCLAGVSVSLGHMVSNQLEVSPRRPCDSHTHSSLALELHAVSADEERFSPVYAHHRLGAPTLPSREGCTLGGMLRVALFLSI